MSDTMEKRIETLRQKRESVMQGAARTSWRSTANLAN